MKRHLISFSLLLIMFSPAYSQDLKKFTLQGSIDNKATGKLYLIYLMASRPLKMTNELIFPTDSLFDTLLYDNNTGGWTFLFSDKVYVSASGFWRLLLKGKILYISLDHGHQFGLTEPLDLVEEVKKTLTGKRLTKIEVDKDTADLTFIMNDDFKLEVYIASSGYETYDFSINNQRYIGLGSGDLSIIDTN